MLHLLVTWAKQQAKNAQSWPQTFSAMTPTVKRASVWNAETEHLMHKV